MITLPPKIFSKDYGLCKKKKKRRIKRHSPSLKNFEKEESKIMQIGVHYPSIIYTFAHLD
jgi:hypothetical protein